jgi:hypothetical protein
VFATSAGLRAATLNAAPPSVSLVNPETGASATTPLDIPATGWLPYDDADGKRAAIAWVGNGSSATAVRVALDQLEKKKGKALHAIRAEAPIGGVTLAGATVALRHGGGGALSLYDIGSDKLAAFQGTGAVQALLLRGEALYVLGRPAPGQTRLSRIALADLSGAAVDVPREADALLPWASAGVALSGPGLAGPWLALWPEGSAPAADGAAAKLHWLEGFALEGALDQEVPW